MATIDMATFPGDGVNRPAKAWAVPSAYVISREINLADVITTKGSAIAASDVIQVLDLPANTLVLGGWAQKTSTFAGTSADLTFSVGVSGSTTNIVNAWDFDAAANLAYGTMGSQANLIPSTSASTIDVTLNAFTGTVTGGKFVVGVVCVDTNKATRNGIAQPQS